MAAQSQQDRASVVADIGADAQLGAGRMTRGQLVEQGPVDQPPLDVALLRPGVGKQDEGAVEAGTGQPRSTSRASSVLQPDVVEPPLIDRASAP